MILTVLPLVVALQVTAPDTVTTLVLPDKDSNLQAGLDAVLAKAPFRERVRRGVLSVALVDMSDPARLRYAGVDDDRMRYAASLPKIGILLGSSTPSSAETSPTRRRCVPRWKR